MKFKYVIHKGMETIELDADTDSVELVLADGAKFELQYRKSDGSVSLNTNGQLIVRPHSSNVARLSTEKF